MDDNKTAEEVLGLKIKKYLIALIASLFGLILLLSLWWRSMKDVSAELHVGAEKILLIWVVIIFASVLAFWWIISLQQNDKFVKYPDYKIDRWKIPDWAKQRKVKICLFVITILVVLFLMIYFGMYWIKKL